MTRPTRLRAGVGDDDGRVVDERRAGRVAAGEDEEALNRRRFKIDKGDARRVAQWHGRATTAHRETGRRHGGARPQRDLLLRRRAAELKKGERLAGGVHDESDLVIARRPAEESGCDRRGGVAAARRERDGEDRQTRTSQRRDRRRRELV